MQIANIFWQFNILDLYTKKIPFGFLLKLHQGQIVLQILHTTFSTPPSSTPVSWLIPDPRPASQDNWPWALGEVV